jgi:hypothetical protein
MIVQREIYATELNEFGVPHNVIVGYEEIEFEEIPVEKTAEERIAELEAKIEALLANNE